MSNFTLFLELGFRHILEGYDHLLFLIGLVIVTRSWRSLLSVISAFTVAHSTTLVLSALGVIRLEPVVTESLIAASITYVGIENVVRREMRSRWIVAGLFGHGGLTAAELQEKARRLLGPGRGGQDRAVVFPEQLQPVVDVACVAVEMGHGKTEFSSEHGARKLGPIS